MMVTLIVLGVGALLAILIYNSLIGKKNAVENAFAGMDALLKKRYDLIPNLVASVQQYMTHERETLEKVTKMRAQASSGNLSTDEAVELDNAISKAIGGIMVSVEAYPELKASDNFNQLQRTLNEVEEQISASRRAYNAAVTSFNNAVEMFPTNIFANMMGYQRRALFEIPEVERQNVNVGELFAK